MDAWNYWTSSGSIRILSSKTKYISVLFLIPFAKNFSKQVYPYLFSEQKRKVNKLNKSKLLKIKPVNERRYYKIPW